jgi:hypothetical protein
MLRHSQQDDTPHVPPTGNEPPLEASEGAEQLKEDINFFTSSEPQEGQPVSLASALITRTLKVFSHFLQKYS